VFGFIILTLVSKDGIAYPANTGMMYATDPFRKTYLASGLNVILPRVAHMNACDLASELVIASATKHNDISAMGKWFSHILSFHFVVDYFS
jgi:hypothetical protein